MKVLLSCERRLRWPSPLSGDVVLYEYSLLCLHIIAHCVLCSAPNKFTLLHAGVSCGNKQFAITAHPHPCTESKLPYGAGNLMRCTSAADPIELGAIAALLLAPNSPGPARQQPLTLTAAKAMMGHSEPAAGLVGLLTLAAEFVHSNAPGLLHLTSLNPYVGSVLNTVRGSTSSSTMGGGLVSMSRQTQGAPLGSRSCMHGGVSSFAFQGTNAHAVLSAVPTGASCYTANAGCVTALIHRQRHWVLPKPHSLLTAAHTNQPTVTMHCQLGDPRLAFLLDHQVLGRALFPAAGMLEAAAAAANTMLSDQSADPLCICAVSDMAIAAPVHLTSSQSEQRSSAVLLQTSINAATGFLQISSSSAGSPQMLNNAKCTVTMAYKSQDVVMHPHSAAETEGALVQVLAGLDGVAEGDEGTRRRRAGPRTGTGAGAGIRPAPSSAASAASADAVGQVDKVAPLVHSFHVAPLRLAGFKKTKW